MLNPNRQANTETAGAIRRAPVWTGVFFSILLCLYLAHLALDGLPMSIPRSADASQAQASLANFHPSHGPLQDPDTHRIPTAHFSGLTTAPASIAIIARGLFSLPVDTETTDAESAMAMLAKPSLYTPSYIDRASWRPIAARRVSIPLYLYHQSLLC